jgi:hypothetical protein
MNPTEKNVLFPTTTCTGFSNPKSSQPDSLPKIKIKINQSRKKNVNLFLYVYINFTTQPKTPPQQNHSTLKNQQSELKTNESHQNPPKRTYSQKGGEGNKTPTKIKSLLLLPV